MKRFATLILLCVSSIASATSIDTRNQVDAALDHQGAHAFFANLSDREADALLDHIATGQTSWVSLAPKLAEGADAGNSEGLAIALAEALPKNPEAVLAVIDPISGDGHSIDVSRVCGIPFIETVPVNYKSTAIHAVRRVTTSKLQSMRNRCLAELRKS